MEENAGKIKEYLAVSFQGYLLPNRKMEKSSKAKISGIIPMYNEEKNVKKSIYSSSASEWFFLSLLNVYFGPSPIIVFNE